MNNSITFFQFLSETIKDHYQKKYFNFLFLFLSISITLNFFWSFEKTVLYPLADTLLGFIFYLFYYGLAYLIPLFFVLAQRKEFNLLTNNYLIILLIVTTSCLAISACYFYIAPIIKSIDDSNTRYLVRKFLVNSRYYVTIALPVILFWKKLKSDNDSFLWFSFKNISISTYVWLVLPVIILVFLASFSQSFLTTYPTFKPWLLQNIHTSLTFFYTVLYELIYGIDFIWVELLFRGVLILGLYKLLGKDAIIPMVSLYCFLHFDKPLGEAISSIVGGYFLGVLAIYTRSIVGGCFLHVAVAWSMDFFALWQYYR